jgi:L-histidine N-alpha-methyltransferase
VKELPAVWLYDEQGSRLYEEITRLPEYYLPRREAEILRDRAALIAKRTQARALAELGAGTAKNSRLLLDALQAAGTLERFIPLDVSEQTLRASAHAIAAAYPRVFVHAIVGDFERHLGALPRDGRRLIAFLGSTIGNLYPERRGRFLGKLASMLAPDEAFLVGLDLVKDVGRLEAAYNDSRGVTETFVRNALAGLNHELGATFDQRRFAYEARWDPEHEWMDIGLRARRAHTIWIPRLELDLAFEEGERLRVEVSSKFRRERFELETARAGLRLDSWWTDAAGDFAVALVLTD